MVSKVVVVALLWIGCGGDNPGTPDAPRDAAAGDAAAERCTAHAQCASGACAVDGACVDPSDVSFIDAFADELNSLCTRDQPCKTIDKAISVVDHHYLVLLSDSYTSTTALQIPNDHWLIGGHPSAPTRLRRTTAGPIVLADTAAPIPTTSLTLENVDIAGAVTQAADDDDFGTGILCKTADLPVALRVIDSHIHGNAGSGIELARCRAEVARTRLDTNGVDNITATVSTLDLDRSILADGGADGLHVTTSAFSVTNSVFDHNARAGITTFSQTGVESRIAFDDFLDNGTFGVACVSGGSVDSSIFAGNAQGAVDNCSTPDQLVGADRASLHLAADYHLEPGSPAIDATHTATVDHDLDGDPRPIGTARDIGADEFKP